MIRAYLFLLLFSHLTVAQVNKGILVHYKSTSLINIDSIYKNPDLSAFMKQQMKQVKENFEKMEYKLHIKQDISYFETVKKMSLGSGINPFAQLENTQTFYVDKDIYLEEIEFKDVKYLITDNAKNFEWNITAETKDILGFTCYKATYIEDKDYKPVTITAWFTPEIPYSFGPKGYHGLPGLILEISRKNKLFFIASTIDFDADVFIIKPTQGKKMTKKDYDKMIFEITEETKKRMSGY